MTVRLWLCVMVHKLEARRHHFMFRVASVQKQSVGFSLGNMEIATPVAMLYFTGGDIYLLYTWLGLVKYV